MFLSSFFWRILISYVALIVVAIGLSWALGAQWVESASQERTRDDLREQALALNDGALQRVRAGYDAEFQARLHQLGRRLATRITIIAEDGEVLADSDEDPRAMNDHSDRPEVVAARRTGAPAWSQRHSDTLGIDMMYVAAPLLAEGGDLVGFVRTARRMGDVRAQLAPLRRAAALAGLIAALLAIAVATLLARRVSGSLRNVTRVAESMASGDYHQRVRSRPSGELGRLSLAFDRMAEELEHRMESVVTDRNRILAILASMAEGVVAIDREERVVHMNAIAERLLRTNLSRGDGLRIWEATRLTGVREILGRAMSEKVPVKGELQLAGGDGRVIEMHASPLTGGREEVVGAVVVLNEVTELRRLEAVRRDFVANVSHELKTPLTAIRGLVETILDDPEMRPEVRRRFLGRVEEQSHRLSALVTDLLTLSRLESEQRRVEHEEVDLRAVLAAAVLRLGPAAETKEIRLDSELDPRSAWVLGDEEELRQMVDNLIDNAIKYTPEGGRIGVRLTLVEGSEGVRDSCLLEVDDTGIGIEPRHQERIFERFYRVDKARSRELGGTGLGLSIVKHVAKDCGGQVSLESAPGVGSTFRVRLPLAV